MKRIFKSTMALVLTLLMLMQVGELSLSYAADAIDRVINPADHIELTVPERFRDGENWFFIPEPSYTASEKSTDKLYIPIQRTGDLDVETEVTLKVSDLSARHDENYTVEIYKEDLDPEIIFDDQSIVDVIQNADGIEEFEPIEDKNELGEMIHEAGGAELVDGEGNTVATITATPVDENGHPIVEDEADSKDEAPANDSAAVIPGAVEEGEWSEGEKDSSKTGSLRDARDAFTGTTSDRQELEGSSLEDIGKNLTDEEFNDKMGDAVTESYPGKEYRLTFAPGEQAKFLVITPMYSPKGEGDAQLVLMLKDPGEGFSIGEDVNPVSVIITDEDEPEPVYVDMADETVVAENGVAVITVNRTGRINALKGVRMASWDGTAKEGDEYSGIGAKLYFSMGLNTRSVKIPVYHGTEEKDFYVSITAITDEQITKATTHVIIPAAKVKDEGSLMGVNNVEGHPLTDPINVRAGSITGGSNSIKSDTEFNLSTRFNVEETTYYWLNNVSNYGYAYDGIYVHFDAAVRWCDAEFRLAKWNSGNFTRMHQNVFEDRGDYPDHWLYGAWGDPKAPDNLSVEAANVDNEGPVGTDSYVEMNVDELRLIKRQFEIKAEPAAVKPLLGMSDNDVLTDYESYYLDGNTATRQTHWTDDSFSITAKTKSPLQLVGLEALCGDKWVRIANIDGKSTTVVVNLTTSVINSLQNLGAIRWSGNGNPTYREEDSTGYSGAFYKGTITVRPVFDYVYATVTVQEDNSHFGSLSAAAPTPSLVWDFSANNNMHGVMRNENQITRSKGFSGSGTYNGYYQIKVSGNDPYVFLDTPYYSDASNLRWVKIKARSASGADCLQLFAECKDMGGYGNSCENIPLQNDGQWHEYVHQITNEQWQNVVNCFRLDPLAGSSDGDHIDIDYIAFFPDEASAKAYKPGNEGKSVALEPGTYTYHLGDVLTFTSTVNEHGEALAMIPDGVQYELRTYGATGAALNANVLHYINGTIDMRLAGETSGGAVVDRPYYRIRPTFTRDSNVLMVDVSEEDYEKLDPTKGILANNTGVGHEEGVYHIFVARNIRSNEIYALNAYLKDEDAAIPAWTLADGSAYSGTVFYMMTNPLPEDNVVTLSVPDGQNLTYVVLYGSVSTSTYNMNTSRSASDVVEAQNAWVSFGEYGIWTDEGGNFELPAIRCANSTRVRYLVDYNGFSSIQEATIPSKKARTYAAETQEGEAVRAVKSNGGSVTVQNFSSEGAHFESVFVQQKGKILGAVDAMALDGKELNVQIKAVGGKYVLNNKQYDETVKKVTVYFMDPETGHMHAVFYSDSVPDKNSAARWGWVPDGNGGGTFTLKIPKFKPDSPNDWTYGDVLMARLTTDKQTVTTFFTGAKEMTYEAVSTGYSVISDPNYSIQDFDLNIDSVAEIVGAEPMTDEDGDLLGDDKRASFGAFPYIGEITAAVHTFAYVANSLTASAEMSTLMNDLANIDSLGDTADDVYDDTDGQSSGSASNGGSDSKSSGGLPSNFTLSILIRFDETFYGGVRFMLGAMVTYGDGQGYSSQKNPFKTGQGIKSAFANVGQTDPTSKLETNLIGHEKTGYGLTAMLSEMGGPYFKFMVYLGIYVDFGFIELKELDENGVPQKSNDAVYMGMGGFIGFGATVGMTWSFLLGPIPAYTNFEVGANFTFFLGSSADPNKTLAEYETLDDFNNKKSVHAQDFNFNFDFRGKIYVSGTFGLGLYKILGVRITVELIFELGYSNNVVKWFPQLFTDGWGTCAEAGFTGTIDLIITSIPVYSASWPLPLGNGFLEYFQEVRRANRCISYVEAGIRAGNGTQEDRDTAYGYCRELEQMVDAYTYDRETIEGATYRIKEWAYNHGIISWTTKNAIEMNKQGGLIGTVMNATMMDDADAADVKFRTNPHVHSKFVGNDGELMAAYGPVSRSDVVTDAFAQTSSKIMSIGNGKFLVVFLDDTLSRERMQAATLKWTIYDSTDGSWTEPQVVQNDSTADSAPSLTDAGDKVILSWASSTDEKSEALKAEFASELKAANGVEPSDADVEEAMEADPARVMSIFDVFTVEFDKATKTFGEITQLTDDDIYDDFPQAVYDSASKDYIVLYNKTAQDDGDYADAGDKLFDLIGAGPNPDKTYSVISYMIYNGTKEADDPYDVGWVTEGFYPNELPEGWTSDDYLAEYGPERYLPTTIVNEDGTYADPPISDLTVGAGLDGLAAFAFTVDRDFDLNSSEDRELYLEYYNFKTHGVYYPLRVAGDITVEQEAYNPETMEYETRESTAQVEVGTPKIIRNGGSTFLFWREDGNTLKYLNISEMLNAKVAGTAEDHDGSDTATKDGNTGDEYFWKYAVQSDGSFAVDALTGKAYTPNTMRVDFGSAITDPAIEITDYNVITDEDDNLYVVWTDSVARKDQTSEEVGGSINSIAQEIYASAMIRQEAKTNEGVNVDGSDAAVTAETAKWSKPYRITRDDDFNDGVALALDEDGGLIIVHNRYSKLTAKSEDEVVRLVKEGKIGLTKDGEGNPYAASLTYNSPITLSVTRCEKIGSLEASLFEFSDSKPVAGETVAVTAAIENVGLIDAEGFKVELYENKDGVRGELIYSGTGDEAIPVNTAGKFSFNWTVPEDGPDGYCIEAVISEKNPKGGYYDSVISYSDVFTAAPDYKITITDAVQEDDQFRVNYSVANRGNAPAEGGTTVVIELQGLYGDLNSELYGNVKENVLYEEDITDKLSVKTSLLNEDTGKGEVEKAVFEDEQMVTIPASVFRFCGYDAVVLKLIDAEGNIIEETSQKLIKMDRPMNLSLNGGRNMFMNVGETASAGLTYDTTAFVNNGSIIYTVDDPNVAEVSEDGTVTAVSGGTTTLTATLLPSNRSVSIKVTVSGVCDRGDNCPMSQFTDLDVNRWYHDGVHWALENGVMAGTGANTFSPNAATTRAMLVTMLWSMEGKPEPKNTKAAFTDVEAGRWYEKAVMWAAQEGITAGTTATTFSPNAQLTREQLATFLRKYSEYKGADVSAAADLTGYTDAASVSNYAQDAVKWAVASGIIGGTSQTTLSPKKSATRAEVATMLMRCYYNITAPLIKSSINYNYPTK